MPRSPASVPDLCFSSRSSFPKEGLSFLLSSSRASCKAMRVASEIRPLELIQIYVVIEWVSVVVLYLVREAVGMYFQRRQLGAEGSGGMLAGAARGHRGPPPKASMARTMISKHNRERLKVGCRHP